MKLFKAIQIAFLKLKSSRMFTNGKITPALAASQGVIDSAFGKTSETANAYSVTLCVTACDQTARMVFKVCVFYIHFS